MSSYKPKAGYPPAAGFGGGRPTFDTYNAGSVNTTTGIQVGQSGIMIATSTNSSDLRWRITVQNDDKLAISYSSDGGKTYTVKMRVSPNEQGSF
jgi:hypothetical protein